MMASLMTVIAFGMVMMLTMMMLVGIMLSVLVLV
jgi:hypothetical protein